MNSVYLLNTRKIDEHLRIVEKIPILIKTEIEMTKAINLGIIEHYTKLEGLCVGAYVTCCELNEGITNLGQARMTGGAYRKEKVIKVSGFIVGGSEAVVIESSTNEYVYLNRIRLSTKEEIEKYRKDRGWITFTDGELFSGFC